MKQTITLELLENLAIIPNTFDKELNALYKPAIEHTNLSIVDYLSIRDLMDFSGYTDINLQALLICMFIAKHNGSTCIKLDAESLEKHLQTFVPQTSKDMATKILKQVLAQKYPELVGEYFDDFKPLIAYTQTDTTYIYFQNNLQSEHYLQQHIIRLLNRKHNEPISAEQISNVMNETLVKRPIQFNNDSIQLNEEQKLAVSRALQNNFTIISGGPGTGKTSIIVAILRCLIECNVAVNKIALAAPTGRAANRIADSIQQQISTLEKPLARDNDLMLIPASTIHRLLKYQPSKNVFTYNAYNHLPIDVLIIDEVSMLDIELMNNTLSSLSPDCKLIFFGDKDQLPSVDAGSVLADLIPQLTKKSASTNSTFDDNIVILKDNYRSESEILELAIRINNQDAESMNEIHSIEINSSAPQSYAELADSNAHASYLIAADPTDRQQWIQLLKSYLDNYFFTACMDSDLSYTDLIKQHAPLSFDTLNEPENSKIFQLLFAYLSHSKILTLLRQSLYGCEPINDILSAYYNGRMHTNSTRHAPGTPIMVTRNDYSKELFNGDIAIILQDADGNSHALFPKRNGYISYPLDTLTGYEAAFAITVHKAQGSEYDKILLPLAGDLNNPLLTKELIYTAVTRAKNRVTFYGSLEALQHAVSQKIDRDSGLVF